MALLAATFRTGRAARRRLHYALAGCTLAALLASIVQAELIGRDYDYPEIRLRVHLGFATAALACIPWVAFTGWRLRTREGARPAHARAVYAFVTLTGGAILTALWMLLGGVPRAE